MYFYNAHGYPWGYDFFNLYSFHNCSLTTSPYLTDGLACGDSRGMVYPPLMYLSFFWTKGFSFPTALNIWTLFILGAFYISGYLWLKSEERQQLWWMPLILLQFPFAFAFERANNDILVLLIWAFAAFSYSKSKYFLSGFFIGVSAIAKLYPFFALGIMSLTALANLIKFKSDKNNSIKSACKLWLAEPLTKLLVGSACAVILVLAITPEMSKEYFFDVLPKWAGQRQGRNVTIHSIHSILPQFKIFGVLLSLLVVYFWAFKSNLLRTKEPRLYLAGLLVLSTYFPGVANDYSLIAILPLWLILLQRSLNFKRAFWMIILSLVSINLIWLWRNPFWDLAGLNIFIQVITLILIVKWPLQDLQSQRAR